MDRLFDILNSHNPYGKGYKSPVNRGNIDYINQTLQKIITYLYSLKMNNGKSLATSGRKTFIIGFDIASKSFISLARRLFSEHPDAKYMLGHKIGQDHLETLFSKIRAKGGFNNNPNVVQFQSALKGLLVKQEVSPSSQANCIEIDADNILVQSRRKPKPPTNETEEDDAANDRTDETIQLTLTTQDLAKPVMDTVDYIGKFWSSYSVNIVCRVIRLTNQTYTL